MMFRSTSKSLTPQEQNQYRAIGARLAVVLRQGKGQSSSAPRLQAIAADLLGDRAELLTPLKDLVSRPGFELLVAKAGSGRGVVERRALLADMEKTYSPEVINALEELVNGFLDLPKAASSLPIQEKAELDSTLNTHEHENLSPQQQIDPSVATASEAKLRQPIRKNLIAALVLGSCATIATLAVISAATIRSQLICFAFGICDNSGQLTGVQQSLQAARLAVSELENADSLMKYRIAVNELELELQRLRSEALSSKQREQQAELFRIKQKAREALRQDEADKEQLKKAAAALALARQLEGSDQIVQLITAKQLLQSIAAGGFAAAAADILSAEVATFQAETNAAAEEPVAEMQPQLRPSSAASSRPPTSDAIANPPVVRPTTTPEIDSRGKWRDQPLF